MSTISTYEAAAVLTKLAHPDEKECKEKELPRPHSQIHDSVKPLGERTIREIKREDEKEDLSKWSLEDLLTSIQQVPVDKPTQMQKPAQILREKIASHFDVLCEGLILADQKKSARVKTLLMNEFLEKFFYYQKKPEKFAKISREMKKKLFEYFEAAFKKNPENKMAAALRGVCLHFGIGTNADQEKAKAFFIEQKDKSHLMKCLHVRIYLFRPSGVMQSPQVSKDLLDLSRHLYFARVLRAEQLFRVLTFHSNPERNKKIIENIRILLKEPLEIGSTYAKYIQGKCLYWEWGQGANKEEAVKRLMEAAALKFSPAQGFLVQYEKRLVPFKWAV